jgi:hypothetical protein
VTRDEIEGHIKRLAIVRSDEEWSDNMHVTLDLAIAMFRERLAKLDGPADGYERVWLKVRERRIQGGLEAFVFQSEHDAKKYVSDRESLAIVVADIPKRVVPVVIGEVSK